MKSVVIASGKGGTGKTSLTALLATVASGAHRVVVADADVEASNLPIALHATEARCTEFPGGQVARIDRDRCGTCGRCEEVCRFGALYPDPRRDTYVADVFACEGCGACVRVCPTGAITMVQSTAGQACTGSSSVGPIAFGQLGPGEDLSGKLVTEVRARAKQAAEAHDADLLFIDGPPGIGCPVIAAVTNTDLLVAVTEPTRSGEHDLMRLVELAKRFGLPMGVVLNKADLSAEGAAGIRQALEELEIPLIAEIPFDPRIARVLNALASDDAEGELRELMGSEHISGVWEWVSARLDGNG